MGASGGSGGVGFGNGRDACQGIAAQMCGGVTGPLPSPPLRGVGLFEPPVRIARPRAVGRLAVHDLLLDDRAPDIEGQLGEGEAEMVIAMPGGNTVLLMHDVFLSAQRGVPRAINQRSHPKRSSLHQVTGITGTTTPYERGCSWGSSWTGVKGLGLLLAAPSPHCEMRWTVSHSLLPGLLRAQLPKNLDRPWQGIRIPQTATRTDRGRVVQDRAVGMHDGPQLAGAQLIQPVSEFLPNLLADGAVEFAAALAHAVDGVAGDGARALPAVALLPDQRAGDAVQEGHG